MALEKTWGHAGNVVHGDTSSGVNQTAWFLRWGLRVLMGLEALVDQAGSALATTGLQDWVIAQCSDSVSVNTSGGDLLAITGTYNPAKFVWTTTIGGARSWVLLYNARLGVWLLVDCMSSVSGNIHHSLLMSTPTTGTTTAPPSATIQLNAQGAAYSGTTGLPVFDQASGLARHVHAHVATDGSFFLLASKDGSGAFQSYLVLHKLTGLQSGDSYPWVFNAGYASGGIFRATTGGDVFQNSGASGMFGYDNGSVQQLWPVYLARPNSATAPGALVDTAQNVDGTWPGGYLWFQTATGKRFKGRAQDWHLCPSSNGDGWLSPTAPAAVLQYQVGFTLIPGRTTPIL